MRMTRQQQQLEASGDTTGGFSHEEALHEIDRLQAIIDSRPAINAGLPESYVEWSQSIYALEASRARGKPS